MLLDVVSAPYDDEEVVVVLLPALVIPRVTPLTLPLVMPRPIPRALDDVAVPATLRLSSSSALLRASSRRCSASAARLSASCCFLSASFSSSVMSFVAPFHSGLRINRWLCSVCERIRVQVFSNVEALSTVLETVCTSVARQSWLIQSAARPRRVRDEAYLGKGPKPQRTSMFPLAL